MAIVRKCDDDVIVEFDNNIDLCYKIDKENQTMSLCLIDVKGQTVSLVFDCKNMKEVDSNIYLDYLIDYFIDMKNSTSEMYSLQKQNDNLLEELEQYASLKARFEGVDKQSTLEVMKEKYKYNLGFTD